MHRSVRFGLRHKRIKFRYMQELDAVRVVPPARSSRVNQHVLL